MRTDSARLQAGYTSLEAGERGESAGGARERSAAELAGGADFAWVSASPWAIVDDLGTGFVARLGLSLILFGSALACEREAKSDRAPHDGPAGSAATLDRMQLSSARRVALQSAADAMQRGDLERLKQLRVWVQKRAQVAIFEPDDLEALELSIGCLERRSTAGSALERLAQLSSGTLRKPAREVCSAKQP
jgi:hypothetical protein